jgi:hypothetical protein
MTSRGWSSSGSWTCSFTALQASDTVPDLDIRHGACGDGQWRKIRWLQRELRWSDTHLINYIKRECGIHHVQFLTVWGARAVINGMEKIMRIERRKDQPAAAREKSSFESGPAPLPRPGMAVTRKRTSGAGREGPDRPAVCITRSARHPERCAGCPATFRG